MGYDEICQKCIELRKEVERSEARFFLGLEEVERRHMKILRDNGCMTFDQFIRSHELCRVDRYRAFVDGLKYVSRQEASAMGAPAVIAMSRVSNENNVPDYKSAVAAWSAEHNGLKPTIQAAERLLKQVDPRPEVPLVSQRMSEIERLRVENAGLRRKVTALERENKKLRGKLKAAAAA